jgi:N-acetylneuraminate synthase
MRIHNTFSINGKQIGEGQPTYIIAEVSANHNGDFARAAELIHAAKECGVDAVKLQTYTPDTLTIRSDSPCFRITGAGIWSGRTLYELYAEAYMPWEWQPNLKEIADALKLDLFSTAFDASAVDFLERIQVPAHKIASFEIVDIPLIQKMAATGKPLIMSTGMVGLAAIEEAIDAARNAGATEIALLKCTSAYPALPSEMNLRTIPHMSQAYGVPVGLSDHTIGTAVPIAAVALGACIVEKHFTLSRKDVGPDSSFSMQPAEMKDLVDSIRIAEAALGRINYGPSPEEAKNLAFQRSLFVTLDTKAGEPFTSNNVRSIRPAGGLHPRYLPDILGRHARQDIPAGTPLAWTHIAYP